MLPEINLQGDVDIAALSPLLRGMLLSVAYADGEGGIGLTATGAMNRKFVHWAAVHFLWPGFTAEDLYSMNKVLNESDMPPLWVVRDMARHLKLLRRKKDVLLPTRRGREFLVNPQAIFDLVATDYLYSYVHATEREEEVRARLRWWRMFLNLLNIKYQGQRRLHANGRCENPLSRAGAFVGHRNDHRSLGVEIRSSVWRLPTLMLARLALRGTRGAHSSAGWILPQDATLGSLPAVGIGYAKRYRRALTISILPLAA